MRLAEAQCRQRFESAPIARLATVDEHGQPHLVPAVFAVDGDVAVIAVDDKPKTSRELRRLRNIEANPLVSLLVDHYAEDWNRLWWVRVDGRARIVREPAAMAAPIDRLVAKYPQYQAVRPAGPVIRVDITRWVGWSAS
ncbi:MAG TPA: TIGR03668 family PPOX class F420-dependent oxidoreductase [Pseudonocardiaceae bacterium]|jgi:PPOX class probable F420-dependent enzyme|nr:TIGR03668 family PPOX class F420-dependent oxidoreductase [Pseudonocardiaceae bacterium]